MKHPQQQNALEDIVDRSGKNLDVVFATIGATLIDPTFAVIAAFLSTMYSFSTSKGNHHPLIPITDYSRLRDIVYQTIIKHTDDIKRKLVEHGVKREDTDRLLHSVVYEDYINKLLLNYN